MASLADELASHFGPSLKIRQSVPAENVTTFKLGGEIALLVEPSNVDTLQSLVSYLSKQGLVWRMLGAGSNVVVADQGIDEVVISLGRGFSKLSCNSEESESSLNCQLLNSNSLSEINLGSDLFKDNLSVLAFSNVSLMRLSKLISVAGFAGLEFAAGIPASIGGAAFMNAGAHDESISQVIKGLYLVDDKGELQYLNTKQLKFAYRSSNLPSPCVIVAVELSFDRGDVQEILTKQDKYLSYRKITQPLHLPSAGSVFKNPSLSSKFNPQQLENFASYPAAKLLDLAGLKGVRSNGVEISAQHANWICKVSAGASAKDVVFLIDHAKQQVKDKFGVELVEELQIWQNVSS